MNFLQLPLYRQIFQHANWQIKTDELSHNVAKWLCDSQSLTQKLQQICQSLTVDITAQGWQAVGSVPDFSKEATQQTAWVREVVLKCDENPVIFAQTILPEITINKVANAVLELGDQPIGLWLFPQNPERLSLEWTFDKASGLYARRSYFTLKGYPLAIYELFLPQFSFEPLGGRE